MKTKCFICNYKLTRVNNHYKKNVSSDIEPISFYAKYYQVCFRCFYIKKNTNKNYQKNIDKIYKYYTDHSKFNTVDQKIIYTKHSRNRCEIIYNSFLKKFRAKKILDYGSGNGSMLYPFLKTKSKLFASDVKNNIGDKIRKNNKFKFISIKKLVHSIEKFDLIVSSHTFEHVINPLKTLRVFKSKLNKNGKIFIQIPDFKNNPFDLIIYDHAFHYSKGSIYKMARKCDLKVELINDKKIFGEMSILLSNSNSAYKIMDNDFKNNLLKAFNFLNNFLKKIKRINKFSIFGTSIAALWVYSNFKNKIISFYDEDENKINQFFMEKKIKKINRNSREIIVLPFYEKKLQKVEERLIKKQSSLNLFY